MNENNLIRLISLIISSEIWQQFLKYSSLNKTYGTKYSRMDQVIFVEDIL